MRTVLLCDVLLLANLHPYFLAASNVPIAGRQICQERRLCQEGYPCGPFHSSGVKFAESTLSPAGSLVLAVSNLRRAPCRRRLHSWQRRHICQEQTLVEITLASGVKYAKINFLPLAPLLPASLPLSGVKFAKSLPPATISSR